MMRRVNEVKLTPLGTRIILTIHVELRLSISLRPEIEHSF